MAGPCDIRARQRLVLRRIEYVDADGRHENSMPRKARAVQHLMEDVRRRAAHLLGALNHGGQRNARQRACERIVVDADDRDVLGHGNTGNHAR
jgi:hypothetical protein